MVNDLIGYNLISSPQSLEADFPRWCDEKLSELNVVGTVNLFYNGTVFVRLGEGFLLTFNKLADTSSGNELCFHPLKPLLQSKMYIIWRRYQMFSPITERLIDEIKRVIGV